MCNIDIIITSDTTPHVTSDKNLHHESLKQISFIYISILTCQLLIFVVHIPIPTIIYIILYVKRIDGVHTHTHLGIGSVQTFPLAYFSLYKILGPRFGRFQLKVNYLLGALEQYIPST